MSENPQQSLSSSAIRMNLGRYMTSEVFELIAGDDVRFFVNKDILASQSGPFRDAINGQWREATERRIELKDWDSDTVARLVEFLYIQDYTYPDPTPLNGNSVPTAGNLPPNQRNAECPFSTSRAMTPPSEWLHTTSAPASDGPASDAERLERFSPGEYDFGDVLLAHAKVYALANYKCVHPLRTFACKRLQLVLSRLHPLQRASHIAVNIVDFVSYVYANTDPLIRTEEPLRKLAAQFVALNLAAFQTEPGAVELVERGGDFVKDLIGKVCRRLPDPDGCSGPVGHPYKGYISNLKVVHGLNLTPPADCITEVNGFDRNISFPYYEYPIWLVPEYTSVASEACTSFHVSTVPVGHIAANNLDLTHGTERYLDGVKDSANSQKITEVALMRIPTIDGIDIQIIKAFDGITADISNRGADDPLYLVWKSVKTRLV